MNTTPALIISILALLISLYSLLSRDCKCDNAPTRPLSDDTDARKTSWFIFGKPTDREVAFFILCVMVSAVVVQGTTELCAVIGLAFAVNTYVVVSCFYGIYFAFLYCDYRHFHYFFAAKDIDTDNHTLQREKDWQSGLRVVALICATAYILAVAVTVVVESTKVI